MTNIAIVEDEKEERDRIRGYIDRFCKERAVSCHVDVFSDGSSFLASYAGGYDLVFMDIELGDENGFDAATKLRSMDENVIIIFVTNLARYAVKGYEISALDFIVKPMTYETFVLKMNRVIEKLKLSDGEITVNARGASVNLPISRIIYVETDGHVAVFHTEDGEYRTYASLKNVEKQINSPLFFKSNSCYLVNLKYVRGVDGFDMNINGEVLQVSRARKSELVKALNMYWGGGLS